MIQKSFFKNKSEFSKSRISHGGGSVGRRKVFRPLDRKKPLHIVLKSSHAKGRMSLLSRKLEVRELVEKKAAKYQIKIHGFENMGNHLHLMVSFKSRKGIQDFMRVISGLIARVVTGAQKGKAFGKRFWDHLAFTRIVMGRRDFAKMTHYLAKNEVERTNGTAIRKGVELHDKMEKEATRRGVPFGQVMEEYLRKASGRLANVAPQGGFRKESLRCLGGAVKNRREGPLHTSLRARSRSCVQEAARQNESGARIQRCGRRDRRRTSGNRESIHSDEFRFRF